MIQARSISRDIWNLPVQEESVLPGSRSMCLRLASTLTSLENLLWQTGGIAQKRRQGFLAPGSSARYRQYQNELFLEMKYQILHWWLLSEEPQALRKLLLLCEKTGNLPMQYMLSSCLPISGKPGLGKPNAWSSTALEALERACRLKPLQTTWEAIMDGKPTTSASPSGGMVTAGKRLSFSMTSSHYHVPLRVQTSH